MKKILLVMIGGALGSLCRFSVNWLAGVFIGHGFPWSTLFVNLAGCLLIGLCFSLSERTRLLGPSARLFIVTGFLGGLTTFSAYSLETATLMREKTSLEFLANIFVNNAGGVILAGAGLWLGSRILRPPR